MAQAHIYKSDDNFGGVISPFLPFLLSGCHAVQQVPEELPHRPL